MQTRTPGGWGEPLTPIMHNMMGVKGDRFKNGQNTLAHKVFIRRIIRRQIVQILQSINIT